MYFEEEKKRKEKKMECKIHEKLLNLHLDTNYSKGTVLLLLFWIQIKVKEQRFSLFLYCN
jgi:hypothetical protein